MMEKRRYLFPRLRSMISVRVLFASDRGVRDGGDLLESMELNLI